MNFNMQNENKDEPIVLSKSIMEYYIASPEDSFFVNGSPPVETVEVVAFDCSWPEIYAKVALSIENALGSSVQKINHVGSTAVQGLAAKPWIDIDLTVADPTDEESYLPALENLGFRLIVREPRFHGHHLFHLENPRVNLHVFAPNCPETTRHLLFRDWLRKSPEDCQLYANAKLEAVKGCEVDIAKYHENKQKVVHEIYTKIFKSLGLTSSSKSPTSMTERHKWWVWTCLMRLKSEEISEVHCCEIGKLLAHIHGIDMKEAQYERNEIHIDWDFYIEQMALHNTELHPLLAQIRSILYESQENGNAAIKKIPDIVTICNNDVDSKNVLWNGNDCRIIDLECLSYSSPFIELYEMALCWSGYEDCNIDFNLFGILIQSYAEAGGQLLTDWETIYDSNYGRLEWLKYNVRSALGIDCSEEEKELGISEVQDTIAHVVYYHKAKSSILNCLTQLQLKTVVCKDNDFSAEALAPSSFEGAKLKNYAVKKLRIIENTPIIETSRLVLRRFTKEDAKALFFILKDKEVNTFLPLFPLETIGDAGKYLKENYLNSYEQPTGYHYAICLKSNNIPIGYVNVGDDDSCDFGYGLRKDFWHKGIVTEACEAVVARLRSAGFIYMTATHDVNNPRSGEVMKKIGMTYRYSYEEQWQPKDILVTFRMYQLNFDGQEERVYREYWDKYSNHFVEEIIDCQEHNFASSWMQRL